MADSHAFEWTCAELERASSLDKLEARGTIRLALKQAGLEARTATGQQMTVVVEKVLPSELQTRGIDAAADICSGLVTGLKGLGDDATPDADSPEEIFKRLGR